jgi:hypothetical protein
MAVPHSRRGPRPIAKPHLPPRSSEIAISTPGGILAAATLINTGRLQEARRLLERLKLSGDA